MGKVKESIAWPNAPDYTSEINKHFSDIYFQHRKNKEYHPIKNKYIVVGDRVEEVKNIVVHEFSILDVDDPDLQIAEPLIKWEKSDEGQWIMKNASDIPSWHRMADHSTFGYRYCIRAKLAGPALTEWLLRKR